MELTPSLLLLVALEHQIPPWQEQHQMEQRQQETQMQMELERQMQMGQVPVQMELPRLDYRKVLELEPQIIQY